MDILTSVISKIYETLTGKVVKDCTIIKKHARNLGKQGDLSFPIELKSWVKYLDFAKETSPVRNILNYLDEEADVCKNIIEKSQNWELKIEKSAILNDYVYLYFDKVSTFENVIKQALNNSNYGSCDLRLPLHIFVTTDCKNTDWNAINLSELRLLLLRNVICNFLIFNGCFVNKDCISNNSDNTQIRLTLRSNKTTKETFDKHCVDIICATVNTSGSKNVTSTATDFLSKRTIDMRLMAEHKYGLRITKQPGWQDFFTKLGRAAVIIELMQNKTNRPVVIKFNNDTPNSKSPSFILYNCARIANILKEFDKKVSNNQYPSLPPLENIDFSLLNQPEEWELLYVYILQFPVLIKESIKDVLLSKIYMQRLCDLLFKMSSVFSAYYRRVRILVEPRTHLFPVIHCRIYFVRAMEQIFHIGLKLLDIEPVKQM